MNVIKNPKFQAGVGVVLVLSLIVTATLALYPPQSKNLNPPQSNKEPAEETTIESSPKRTEPRTSAR